MPIPHILELIDLGVGFIHQNQLPWGEIANYTLPDKIHSERVWRSAVFPTALVLHSLSMLDRNEKLHAIITKGVQFLLTSKEGDYWKYFGPGSEYPADLDTTACCLSVLNELGENVDMTIVDNLLKNRDRSTKLFHTWAGDSPLSENDFDSAVNANILWLYALLNKPHKIKEVIEYVVEESCKLHTQNSQVWYCSPQIFSYFVSRVFSTKRVRGLERARDSIVNYLTFTQSEDGGWGNCLETAFVLNTFMNFGIHGGAVRKGINYLMENADVGNGCWGMGFLYPFGGDGSEEITTAVCLEALANSIKLSQN